ncbi:MAG: alpha/beta fold hydrolase [Acidimicrobiaceae bacterium]|jgi:3-oxoadipate enol-lactonase|nr:alpha/beta fold hydrolase [Acidimicrobiaceae bacterium]MBT5582274.1 alpha/beta fold hydrolase [Acidimicrobiaceae bacterium]MBT5851683.1 alpha/beta fold hydrolase [Acidimicrobiaceae bacterium]
MSYITTSDGIVIHFTQWGDPDGEAVLFIHGLGADNIGWVRQRQAFSAYRCIAVDNRGSGGSDKPLGPYSLERMARDAVEVLDRLDVEQAHVIGASMGGALAQIITLGFPERVHTLVLACTACDLGWRHELFDEWEDLIRTQGMRAFAIKNFEWLFGQRSVRRLYPIAALVGPFLVRAPADAFIAQLDAIRNFDGTRAFDAGTTEELAQVTAPTLVITGSQDILTPVADAEEIAARIPRSELVVIHGQAHGFMVEGARHFNRAVLDFLDRARVQRRAASLPGRFLQE